jgi:hypothetical protein
MKTGDKLCFIATVIIVAASEICFALDDGDFQYWSTGDFSFDINKDWKFTFQEEFRLGESGGHLYYQHSEAGFTYKSLADWIDLGFGYRQVFEKDSKGQWKQENQPNINVTLKGKLLGLDVSDRSRIEYRDLEDRKDVWRYRNKVAVKLPFELTELKLQPYIADEIFIPLNDDNVDKNRFYAGVSLKLTKNLKSDIYYMWQSSRGAGNWTDINVVGTALKFSF